MTAEAVVNLPGAAHAQAARPIVLIGLMGAGKSNIGRRLARLLETPFIDTDEEIVHVTGLSVAGLFERFGEPAFRCVERQVVTGLIDGTPRVLASGGGAFMDPEIRAAVRRGATSVWLRADLELLVRRTVGRAGRPLLATGDERATLGRLMAERYPVYAEADVIVDTRDDPAENTVQRVMEALAEGRMLIMPSTKGLEE